MSAGVTTAFSPIARPATGSTANARADAVRPASELGQAARGFAFLTAKDGAVNAVAHAPAMIALRNATWRAKAARPAGLALTVVRGRRATKALVTST
jgi:hypothetical protein